MLIKVNDNLYAHAKDIRCVKKITHTSSDNYGEWIAVVEEATGPQSYLLKKGDEVILVNSINTYLSGNT